MAITALWTHGTAVVPETPDLLVKERRLGFGTEVRLKRNTEQWFHVPMPTPAFLNGVRPKLARVIILGKSEPSSVIRRVHIFDGSARMQDHPTLIGGDKLEFSQDSVVSTDNLPIFKGLGISMFIESDSGAFEAEFFFAAFGADWE